MIDGSYQLSIWEDVVAYRAKDGSISRQKQHIDDIRFYDEDLIAIIGADDLKTPIMATNPVWTKNVNGQKTLRFTLYSIFFDENDEVIKQNPYCKYLVNERKLKFKYKNEWYDLIIKDIEENSEEHSFTYTAIDLHTNELSKNGFNIEFDTDLNNNTGTLEYFATEILKGTDWQLGESETFQQRIEEPLYEIVLNNDLQATYYEFEYYGGKLHRNIKTETIRKGQTLLVTYTSMNDRNALFQFFYNANGYIEIDNVIQNSKDWFLEDVQYKNGYPIFSDTRGLIPSHYRGKRLVPSYKTLFDINSEQTVTIYENDDGAQLYGYLKSVYTDPMILSDYLVSGHAFTSAAGWNGSDDNVVDLSVVPSWLEDLKEGEVRRSYLTMTAPSALKVYNSGLKDGILTEGLLNQQKYVFAFKGIKDYNIRCKICKYTKELKDDLVTYKLTDTILDCFVPYQGEISSDLEGMTILTGTCTRSVTLEELKKDEYGIFITGAAGIYSFESLGLFKFLEIDGVLVSPYDVTITSEIKTLHRYYVPQEVNEPSEINYYYEGYEPLKDYKAVDNTTFEKVRTITASESNRFNLLQDLCETFECWVQFQVQHDNNGKIVWESYEENGETYWRPCKRVCFKEFVGQDNYRGFKYGINLKNTIRNLDSNQAITKLIVKANSNEFAPNGFCTIARAPSSPTGETFLLNFDYYVRQGLLNNNIIIDDLYSTNGYYTQLRRLNNAREPLTEEQTTLTSVILPQIDSDLQVYTLAYNAALESLDNLDYSFQLAGTNRIDLMKVAAKPVTQQTQEERTLVLATSEFLTEAEVYLKAIQDFQALMEQAVARKEYYQTRADEVQEQLDSLVIQKQKLNEEFYNKYYRFLQEGSWIQEDYIDDELYYLDADSLLRNSISPKVSYNISVLDLINVPGYENYVYDVGDKSYIEDVEFFGYVYKQGSDSKIPLKTPYQEEIVITETTDYLDTPEQNSFKVQNYKTQFEDLFQRITATTNAIQYASGSYNRAASIVTSTGEIKESVLQSTLSNSSYVLENAKDQSVSWDETGIVVTNLAKPNEIVRLVSGGILLSDDAGASWSSGITGAGINTAALTAGVIQADKINIMSGNFPSFRWDQNGLNAYRYTRINPDTGIAEGFRSSQFVRFDQYGLYGFYSDVDTIFENTTQVMDKADFALTWDGFKISTNRGAVTITKDKDIQVFSKDQERIHIGLIEADNYGIRIKDADNHTVLTTKNDGTLWLQNALNIENLNGNHVFIGSRFDEEAEKTQILNANDNFVVWDDGSFLATNGTFTGVVNATGGQIGNITVDTLNELGADTGVIRVTANAVNAAFQTGGVRMDSNGLTVNNANFRVVKTETDEDGNSIEVPVMQAGADGNLWVKGSGEFDGSITAQDGRIGGFYIGTNYLSDGEGGTGNLVLTSGEDSSVKVANLFVTGDSELSGTLNVQDRIYLGTDEKEPHSVMSYRNDQETYLKLLDTGDIIGKKWSITADGHASFEDATISGTITSAKIQAGEFSVVHFKTGDTRSMGGAFIFKPSELPESIDGLTYRFSREFIQQVEVGGYCYINDDKYAKIAAIDTENNTLTFEDTTILGIIDASEVTSLVYFGKEQDSIIGINSDNVASSILPPRSISVSSLERAGLYKTRIVLGDLEASGVGRGYGLYADNVTLMGRLTTAVRSGASYAGINTEDGANSIMFDNDHSAIVFWAGSLTDATADIQNAKFQVTEEGSLYASQGLFTGSIISNSVVEGSVIKSPKIVGSGSRRAALEIYSADENENQQSGILFKDKYLPTNEEAEKVVLGLFADRFVINNTNFVEFDTKEADLIHFIGTDFGIKYTENDINYTLALESTGLNLFSMQEGAKVIAGGISVSPEEVQISQNNISGDTTITLNKENIRCDVGEVIITKSLTLGEAANGLVYQRVDEGYDLYVS